MTHLLLTCAFLFLLWRLCAPGESVVAEMADMESGVESGLSYSLPSFGLDYSWRRHAGGCSPHDRDPHTICNVMRYPHKTRKAHRVAKDTAGEARAGVAPRLSLPAISPELEHAAIRMVEEWR